MLGLHEQRYPSDPTLYGSEEQKYSRSMPITISEDSDDEELLARSIASNRNKPRRCVSLPTCLNQRSIMKRRTLDESLHSTYGSEDDMLSPRSRRHLSLQFDKINIREYSRTVGDNPSCSSGPPVSISWEYNILGDIGVDEYESTRPPRRVQNEMILPRGMREDMLRFEWNASRKEITESVRRNVRVKNQRRTTVNNLGKAMKFEEAMESASRKLKRFVKRQKKVSRQVQDLEDQLEVTNRRRSKLLYLEQNMSQGGDDSSLPSRPPSRSRLVYLEKNMSQDGDDLSLHSRSSYNSRPSYHSRPEETIVFAETEAAPIEKDPVRRAPIETVPVKTVPIKTAPPETAPPEMAPHDTTPMEKPSLVLSDTSDVSVSA